MKAEPQQQHHWLHKLVGEWTVEGECVMGPDQPTMAHSGTETVRSMGGLWTIGEGESPGPDGAASKSVMTLGFDPLSQRFVGTFIASIMTYLWVYSGSLNEAENVLVLDAEGPSFTSPGLVKYQDRIEFVDDNHRILTSHALGEDGEWHQFMTAHYHRKK